MLTTRWWVEVEDCRQATDLEIRQELRPDGTCVAFDLGVLTEGGRRHRRRLLLRCYDDGTTTVAWDRPREEI